tara:strand:- start:77 stop:655 length:579 start_codon:yes stop_codon:yes gene_type:complete
MATLNATNLKHASSSSNNIVLAADGSTTISNLSGGGKILQVVQTHYSDRVSNSTASGGEWAPSQLNTSITPSATNSKVLITAKVAVGHEIGQRQVYMSCYRGTTQIAQANASGNNTVVMSSGILIEHSNIVTDLFFNFLDTPNTTSATTYSFRFKHSQTATAILYINRGHTLQNRVQDAYLSSNVTLMEVAA